MSISPGRLLSGFLALLLNRYTAFLLLLLCGTEYLARHGGLPSPLPAWRMELPLLLYTYWYLNRITRPSPLQAWITALPLLLVYAGLDAYHLMFGRLPRIAEVAQLQELFTVLQTPGRVTGILLVIVPLLALLLLLDRKRIPSMLAGLVPFLLLVLPIQFLPAAFLDVFSRTQRYVFPYSDVMSVELNGRVTMTLYNHAKKQLALEKLADHKNDPDTLKEFTIMSEAVLSQDRKPNVHMIVLESFMDPTLLEQAEFSRSPVHPDFAALFAGGRSFSLSPVFGGNTAQAEFEVLCGVPAFRELSGVEFDVFSGARTSCLPHILNQAGYQTVATNSFTPDFFNATNAMAGVGFERTHFPQEYAPSRDSYLSVSSISTDEGYIFDDDLLQQNLRFVREKIAEHPDRPLFNYVLTVYGHTPNLIDTDKRPMLIELGKGSEDIELVRYVNQYYYRTEAIARFVRELMRIDPHSMIVLISDHVPPLRFGALTYKELGYLGGEESLNHMNQVFFLENGRVVRHGTIRHFDIPRIVLNYITEGRYCRENSCGYATLKNDTGLENYREEYRVIMSQAMNSRNSSSDFASLAGVEKTGDLLQSGQEIAVSGIH